MGNNTNNNSMNSSEEDDDEFDDVVSEISRENRALSVEPPKRRGRKISLFSVNQHALEKKRISMATDKKGEFTITHCDTSEKRAQQEMSYGFFDNRIEVPKEKRNVTSPFSESRSSFRTFLEPSRVEERRYDVEPVIQFNVTKVKQVIFEEFAAIKHLPTVNQKVTCKDLCNTIKRKVKDLGFARYRYVVTVTIGTDKNQGLVIASRFFWDEKRDNYVSESMKMENSFLLVN